MPYQPINFASIDPLGLPALRNIVPEIKGGLELARLPEHLRQQAEKERLGNVLQGLQAQYMPQQMEQESEHSRLANQLLGLQAQYIPQQMQQEADRSGLSNQMLRMQIQNLPKEVQSRIALNAARMQKAQQETSKSEFLNQFLRDQLQGGQGGQAGGGQAGQEQGEGGVAPSQQGGMNLPSDIAQQILRKSWNLPAETPQEKYNRQVDLVKQKRGEPTSQTKSRLDRIETLGEPLYSGLEEALKKGRLHSSFNKTIESLGETFALAKGYPQGEGTTKMAIDILKPSARENVLDALGFNRYEERIRGELKHMAPSISQSYTRKGLEVPQVIKKYLNAGGSDSSESSGGTILIEDPKTGKRHVVPRDKLKDALSAGGKRVDF